MLTVQNVEVVYHSVVQVLRGVTLRVPERSIVALLGPNGAGKTTALRAIGGLLAIHDGAVTKGRIEFAGEPLERLGADGRVRLGMAQVLEGRRILGELTVEENLRAGAVGESAGARARRVEEAYARFPLLAERRRQKAGYLSGGEQQILAVCRALMRSPRLLLVDEPFLGLAPRAVTQVAELLRGIHADGVSMLLVEQNAALALQLADHAYVLETGRVVIEGPAAELRDDPDVREFYLGFGREGRRSYREVKRYRRRRRWLS
jgi:branched-chain amino acid transport system ATP-binding protein